MNRPPVPGECVVVTRNTGEHGARVGDRFIVTSVDENDDTLRGIPRGFTTIPDFWIPWSDVEPVTFGWEYARGHMPSDITRLLAACDGIEHLSLNRQIKAVIFESLPDWRERVMEVLETIDMDEF